MTRNRQPDADDLFADTRMSFGDHIEDLRTHLWRALIGFGIAMVVSFGFSVYVLDFIQKPVVKALKEFHVRQQIKKRKELKDNPDPNANKAKEIAFEVRPNDLAGALATLLEQPPPPDGVALDKDELAAKNALKSMLAKQFPPPAPGAVPNDTGIPLLLLLRPSENPLSLDIPESLIVLSITEGMMVWLQVSFLCGLVLGSPWIFYQIWTFVAAGLYAKEKRLVNVYMPFSLVLFLAGVFLCEFVVIPQAVKVLLEFDEWLGVDANLRLEDWLSFALMMPVVFGVSFQTPMVMLLLAKIGIFDADSFRSKRRIAWLVLAVLAALIMPTQDPWTILMMQVPLIALYEFGILLAAYVGRQKAEEEVVDPDEMVGV